MLPALQAQDEKTAERVPGFFAAKIRNKSTRKACAPAAGDFAARCAVHNHRGPALVRTLHVGADIEEPGKTALAPSVELKPAALRMPFDHPDKPGGDSQPGKNSMN